MNSGPRVLVVGAGPAGASLALLLARSGVAVTLVEASSSLARQFRGEALMPSGLEALAAMGLSHLLAAVPHRPLQGWRFVVNGRELFHAHEPLSGDPQRPCTLVNQPALLEALLGQAQSCPSFVLERGQPVSDLLWSQGRVAGVRLRNGRHLEAELVVACDGRASLLRQKAGLVLVEGVNSIDLLWFQLACPSPSPLQGSFTTLVGPEGVFSAFDSAGGGVQLGWLLNKGERVPACSPDDWIERMAPLSPPELAAWLRQWRAGLGEPSRLAVQVGLAERWWAPGLLLLGDAAHPMSPVRAQGINMALRDAWVASARLLPLLQPLLRPAPAPQQPQHGAPGAKTTAITGLDAALAAIEAERRPEITTLQALQAAEAARGDQLRRQSWLRRGLALAAPLVGPAIAAHWSHQQQPLRQGLSELPGSP
ncbi:FAD-dependent monooxygenase [Cyanobium sp. Alchichica 3B3-8F6]|uniref:FAD-dependent monooxygenase n=1 Tax=Cyanobium sp. Alchichica 3B3-8F6 TaxID=2823696 RepID=UPI0020CFA72D|nr:FAD-dependent monooxygenase [Cyanobium sp. Alchichica 3B3-8F6]MCP9882894.1 FAD-dependent monooxygenase [Cyanobium sp. Alchichica 3B3-8F6]